MKSILETRPPTEPALPQIPKKLKSINKPFRPIFSRALLTIANHTIPLLNKPDCSISPKNHTISINFGSSTLGKLHSHIFYLHHRMIKFSERNLICDNCGNRPVSIRYVTFPAQDTYTEFWFCSQTCSDEFNTAHDEEMTPFYNKPGYIPYE